jgi:hypothetical protein
VTLTLDWNDAFQSYNDSLEQLTVTVPIEGLAEDIVGSFVAVLDTDAMETAKNDSVSLQAIGSRNSYGVTTTKKVANELTYAEISWSGSVTSKTRVKNAGTPQQEVYFEPLPNQPSPVTPPNSNVDTGVNCVVPRSLLENLEAGLRAVDSANWDVGLASAGMVAADTGLIACAIPASPACWLALAAKASAAANLVRAVKGLQSAQKWVDSARSAIREWKRDNCKSK